MARVRSVKIFVPFNDGSGREMPMELHFPGNGCSHDADEVSNDEQVDPGEKLQGQEVIQAMYVATANEPDPPPEERRKIKNRRLHQECGCVFMELRDEVLAMKAGTRPLESTRQPIRGKKPICNPARYQRLPKNLRVPAE